MDSLTIGYDAKKIACNFTGIGNYSRAVVNILSHHYPDNTYLLYSPRSPRDPGRDDMPREHNVSFVLPHGPCAMGMLREVWRCYNIKREICWRGVDLYHGLSNELPFGIDTVCPSVVTIHDLIFMRYPEVYGRVQRAILEYKTRRACREATRIIAISEATRRDIIEFYGVDENRIDVVYQGCNNVFRQKLNEELKEEVRKLYSLPGRYIVAVGTLEWRKNQESLVRALPYINKEIGVVLVGRGESEKERLERLAVELGVINRLRILQGVGFMHLPAIYQSAWAAAYMSRIEGFGIPVLEAVVSGLPVVAATGTCLEEAGGPGGIYCSPDCPQEIAEAFNHLLSHPEDVKMRIRQGHEYAARFCDENIAHDMMDVYVKAFS